MKRVLTNFRKEMEEDKIIREEKEITKAAENQLKGKLNKGTIEPEKSCKKM